MVDYMFGGFNPGSDMRHRCLTSVSFFWTYHCFETALSVDQVQSWIRKTSTIYFNIYIYIIITYIYIYDVYSVEVNVFIKQESEMVAIEHSQLVVN